MIASVAASSSSSSYRSSSSVYIHLHIIERCPGLYGMLEYDLAAAPLFVCVSCSVRSGCLYLFLGVVFFLIMILIALLLAAHMRSISWNVYACYAEYCSSFPVVAVVDDALSVCRLSPRSSYISYCVVLLASSLSHNDEYSVLSSTDHVLLSRPLCLVSVHGFFLQPTKPHNLLLLVYMYVTIRSRFSACFLACVVVCLLCVCLAVFVSVADGYAAALCAHYVFHYGGDDPAEADVADTSVRHPRSPHVTLLLLSRLILFFFCYVSWGLFFFCPS